MFTDVLMSVENCCVGNLRVKSVKEGEKKKKVAGKSLFQCSELNTFNCFFKLQSSIYDAEYIL